MKEHILTSLEEGNLNIELIKELRTPVFLKTKVDVVYSDINNWDLEEILYYSSSGKKGGQNRLTYIDYIWLKIVKELKGYNFSISEIKSYRDQMFKSIDKDLLVKVVREQMHLTTLSDQEKQEVLNTDLKEVFEGIDITTMDMLISEGILMGSKTNLLFFKYPTEVIGISQRALQEIQKNGYAEELEKFNERTHLNLSLRPILSKFVKESTIDKSKDMILSREEYAMLTEIRKRLKDIKSVTIKYKEGQIDRIDIERMKSVKAESSLMAVIKSAEYSSIEMITQKGNIVCVNHTEKIKL